MDRDVAEKLSQACRMLAAEGHANLTMGHVTARVPGKDAFYMNAHDFGLDEIVPSRILTVDFEGNQLAGHGRIHSEYPIHAELYRANPNLGCIVHTHPFYSIVVGATLGRIQPISHEGSIFADIPLFEETALLIRTPELGRSVAESLGGHRAMLLRNHGIVVASESVEAASVYAVLLERAARIQVTAARVGPVTASASQEAPEKRRQVFYPRNIQGFWNYLLRKWQV